MTDDVKAAEMDARSALLLIESLVIALMEGGQLDGEALRRIMDDIVSAETDDNPDFKAGIERRVAAISRASYAVTPADGGALDDLKIPPRAEPEPG